MSDAKRFVTGHVLSLIALGIDDAGMPIARGFVKSEDFSWGHWLDTYLMWPEAVPFHPATPESAA